MQTLKLLTVKMNQYFQHRRKFLQLESNRAGWDIAVKVFWANWRADTYHGRRYNLTPKEKRPVGISPLWIRKMK